MSFYKSIKPTKRLTISLEKFPKTAKNIGSTYRDGASFTRDSINSLSFYSYVSGTIRFTVVLRDKNPNGHCSS